MTSHLIYIQSITDNLRARYWNMGSEGGGPDTWTVPPPWKLYFDPWVSRQRWTYTHCAGMVHSSSRWMWGVQVKLRDSLRTRAIPERLRGVFTTKCYTNPRLPLPYCYGQWSPSLL